jgi:hypothetical protein
MDPVFRLCLEGLRVPIRSSVGGGSPGTWSLPPRCTSESDSVNNSFAGSGPSCDASGWLPWIGGERSLYVEWRHPRECPENVEAGVGASGSGKGRRGTSGSGGRHRGRRTSYGMDRAGDTGAADPGWISGKGRRAGFAQRATSARGGGCMDDGWRRASIWRMRWAEVPKYG